MLHLPHSFALLSRDHLRVLRESRARGGLDPESAKRQILSLFEYLRYDASEFQLGTTKLFLRHPETVSFSFMEWRGKRNLVVVPVNCPLRF